LIRSAIHLQKTPYVDRPASIATPIHVIVLAIFILIAGPLSILQTPKRHFPRYQYPGLRRYLEFHRNAGTRILEPDHFGLRKNSHAGVNDIEHIESTSTMELESSRSTFSQTPVSRGNGSTHLPPLRLLKQLPPGETPPLILSFSASNGRFCAWV